MGASFQSLSTSTVEASSQFDYWRSFFLGAFLDRPKSNAAKSFHGQYLGGGTTDGVCYHNLRADDLVSHFGRLDSGLVLFGFVRSGQVHVEHGNDRRDVIDSSTGLVLFDCDRPITTQSSHGHDICYLAMPRSTVMATIGRDPNGGIAPLQYLPKDGFATVLRAHMDEIAGHGETMSEPRALATMQAAFALALAALGEVNETSSTEPEIIDQALYDAACRQIDLNAHDPSLTVDRIVAQLNCSRAHLYRLFLRRDETVAGYLRTTRLKRAYRILETEPETPISLVAFRCGYADLSAFGKAFKRRFGITPTDLRQVPSFESQN